MVESITSDVMDMGEFYITDAFYDPKTGLVRPACNAMLRSKVWIRPSLPELPIWAAPPRPGTCITTGWINGAGGGVTS
jgi:hypothetical protein